MKTSIVLGLQFGDEGKGVATSWLASQSRQPLVIRFSGGHQAGHTVVHNGVRHVFSSFGSGTLHGAPTFLSRFCTFYPTSVYNEYKRLVFMGVRPLLYVDALAPVTTPYDHYANQVQALSTQHGSVGVGFGTTIKRHEAHFRLYVQDLFFETILTAKLANILAWYNDVEKVDFPPEMDAKMSFWRDAVHSLVGDNVISRDRLAFPAMTSDGQQFNHFIFEGSQGILLDMEFGFFPNVTRSHTTSKYALSLISEYGLPSPDIYCITRAYQTRHGNGFMTNEHIPLQLANNDSETNKEAAYQGMFRVAPLDVDLIQYAMQCETSVSKGCGKHLVVTCLDQLPPQIPHTHNGNLAEGDIASIIQKINYPFQSTLFSNSADSALSDAALSFK